MTCPIHGSSGMVEDAHSMRTSDRVACRADLCGCGGSDEWETAAAAGRGQMDAAGCKGAAEEPVKSRPCSLYVCDSRSIDECERVSATVHAAAGHACSVRTVCMEKPLDSNAIDLCM